MRVRGSGTHAVLCALAAVSLIIVGACGDDGDGISADPADSAPAAGTTSAPVTPAPATSPAPTTSVQRPTTIEQPTTTTVEAQDICDGQLGAMLTVVDGSIGAARLVSGAAWSDDIVATVFDDRTNTAEEFAYRMGLDCGVRLAQETATGDERLVLAAWTGDRRAWVVQATDAPETAFRPDQRVQLFIGQPEGEWLVDQFVWAGSLQTGETMIVGTVDTAFGVAAKSWWNEVPRFDDIEVTNEAEQYAIDALVDAGARNVSVAEPADVGSEFAAVQFITPLGLHLIATVAPPDWFDPAAALVEGEMTVERIGGVDVYVTAAVPESYAVGAVGWTCGDHVWFIDSSYGTVDELRDWTSHLIESLECRANGG